MLTERFQLIAAQHPGRIAVDAPPTLARPKRVQRSYRDVANTAYALAHTLRSALEGEGIVALAFERGSPDLYAAQLGVLFAGGAYLCLDSSYPDQRIRELLEEAEPVSIVSDAVMETRLAEPVIRIDEYLPEGRRTPIAGPPVVPWLGPNSLAYVIFTSGTSGRPKGVLLEHAGIENLVASDVERFKLTPEDRCAQGSSPAYDSSVEEIWLAFSVGATLVVMDEATARLGPDLVSWLSEEAITVLCPPPTLLRSMGCSDPARALPELKLVYVGGEALPTDIADTWGQAVWLENGYGPTECTVTVLRARINSGQSVSIGRPIPPHQAYILDDALKPVPQGTRGELFIGGIGLARGYLKAPDLTAKRFISHPSLGRLYRTGDLCQQEADGSYSYFGRIDAQVKVRGHRIELEEVESRLVAKNGISEAVCTVIGGRLIAGIVREPADRRSAGEVVELVQDALRNEVPEAMRPAVYEWLDAVPRNQSGKLDRRSFGNQFAAQQREVTSSSDHFEPANPPSDPTEAAIVHALQEVLALPSPAPLHSDFFSELGGDSLSAALVISRLRTNALTESLAVRDIYDARTAVKLSERARSRAIQDDVGTIPGDSGSATAPSNGTSEPATRGMRQRANWVQLGVLFLLALTASVPTAWITFVLLPDVVRGLGLYAFVFLFPLARFAFAWIYLPFSLLLLLAAKKCLIGSYQAAEIPVWSGAYLRHWVVEVLARLVPFGMLQGTVFASSALRLLGAKIGKRVHIHRGVDLFRGGWDLLTLGDDVTLSQDSALRLQMLQNGKLIVGPIEVGAGATLDVRAGLAPHSQMGSGAVLSALSTIDSGTSIPDGELWEGVPAQHIGPAESFDESSDSGLSHEHGAALHPVLHGLYLMAVQACVRLGIDLPFTALIWIYAWSAGLDQDNVLEWLFAPNFGGRVLGPLMALAVVSGVVTLIMQALAVRVLDRVPSGTVSRWSRSYARLWLTSGIVERAGERLSGTLFWPQWLRLAGMRIGRNSEISTITDVIPSSLEIGKECFFADGIYLGGPRIHQGRVTTLATKFGSNTFLGNHAVIPTGEQLPSDLLIGICTVGDGGSMKRGSGWFGIPSFELPRREVIDLDRSLTHDPGPLRFIHRVAWELLRFLLPIPVLLLALVAIKWVASTVPLATEYWFILGLATLAASMAVAGALCAFVVGLKWVLLGRVKPGQHGFWSAWCCRWDLVYVVWGAYARRVMSAFEGTQAIIPWARLMGAKIGTGTVLGRGFAQIVDPDMIHIEAGATVDNLFQAHSFEDRVLKIDHVHIRSNASVGANAVMLYGADVGEGASVAPHSVVMKREQLLPGRHYAGAPLSETAKA